MSGSLHRSRLDTLSAWHRERLQWFEQAAGTSVRWRELNREEMRLACAPKGIFKPEDLQHALSVRITADSGYPDGEVHRRKNGSWYLTYHQEGPDPAARDRRYTNRGLMDCVKDKVPVGLL